MEYQEYLKEIYAEWRRKCFFDTKLGIVILGCADLVIFYLLFSSGTLKAENYDWYKYLFERVVLPISISLLALLFAQHKTKKAVREEDKNFYALSSLTTITCVVAAFNNYFILLLGLPVLSIIESISFGDRALIKKNLKLVGIGVSISCVTFAYDKAFRDNGQYVFMTILVLVIFYICIIMFAFSLADIHKKNLQTAFEGLIHRDELLNRLHRDNLTGLFNKNYLREYIPQLDRSREIFIALLDFDNFKTINDQEGHLAGDDVLRDVGMILECVSRENAKVFRFGGDEFVVVGECNQNDFNSIIKCAMTDLSTKLSSSTKQIRITTSVGATKLLAEDTIDSVLERADKLMYQAKQNGKNCCESDI